MRVAICAVGRLRKGPEADLVADYLDRFARTGRTLGLGPAHVTEVEDRSGSGPDAEASLLRRALPEGAVSVALDQRGRTWSSSDLAGRLAAWRDDGAGQLAFLIGGADGIAPDLRDACTERLSFGPMIWPHRLARVMLAEQLYRCAAILAGTPYHRP